MYLARFYPCIFSDVLSDKMAEKGMMRHQD